MAEKKKRFSVKPLLVASAGLAVIAVGACGGATSGNLVAPRCPDGGVDTGTNCQATDGGTKDAGP